MTFRDRLIRIVDIQKRYRSDIERFILGNNTKNNNVVNFDHWCLAFWIVSMEIKWKLKQNYKTSNNVEGKRFGNSCLSFFSFISIECKYICLFGRQWFSNISLPLWVHYLPWNRQKLGTRWYDNENRKKRVSKLFFLSFFLSFRFN